AFCGTRQPGSTADGPRQDVADPLGAQSRGRRLSHADAVGAARRVDDTLRIAAGQDGRVGVLLLRRYRGPRARPAHRDSTAGTARGVRFFQKPWFVSNGNARMSVSEKSLAAHEYVRAIAPYQAGKPI